LSVVGCRLSVIGCQLSVVGCHLSAVKGRMLIQKGKNKICLIDDTYNANVLSLDAAMRVLSNCSGEKVLVLGDMGELGEAAENFHREAGLKAQTLGINKLYSCGNLSQLASDSFGSNGEHFGDQGSLIKRLTEEVHPEMTILIKGSRAAEMENVVKQLTTDN